MFTKMSGGAWQTVGNIASTASVTTIAIGGAKGILAGYHTYASPHTCLTETEKVLKRVKSRLQGLSPKRRKEIEIATRSESSNCSSLKILEDELEECVYWLIPSLFRIEVHESLVSWICTGN